MTDAPEEVPGPRRDRRRSRRGGRARERRRRRRGAPPGRARARAPRHGEARLPRPRRPQRPDPAPLPAGAHGRGRRPPRRHRRRDRQADEEPPRRAVADRRRARAALAHPLAAARHVPRPDRRRAALSPPLPRPADERGDARDFLLRSRMVRAIRHHLDADGFVEVEVPVLQPRYGGAFGRPFVTHHNELDDGSLPAHRDRALPQAPDRRRPRAGLRDRPRLPQRGRLVQAQPGVHDARVVRGVRRLPRHDGALRDARRGGRARDDRDDEGALPRARRRPEAALEARQARRRAAGARRLVVRRGRAALDPRRARHRHDPGQDVRAARSTTR